MNLLEYIPQLAAAGAMGVGILIILRVYALLKTEQAKDAPRPTILRSIYVFMGFGLVMTLVALGIEASRFFFTEEEGTGELAQLRTALAQLEEQTFYGLNENGNPTPIRLEANGKKYTLAEAFPDTAFAATPLNLIPAAGRYRAVKDLGGRQITYGYFPERELRSRLTTFFAATDPTTPPPPPSTGSKPEQTYAAGRAYTPGRILSGLRLRDITDASKANARLLDFLSTPAADNETLRKEAVKLLIQPRMMEELSEAGHDRLIELLSDNSVRNAPWRYYEAAQVYLSRYHLKGDTNVSDLERHKELSREYRTAYERRGWTREERPAEFAYYQSAGRALGVTIE